MKYDYVIVGGGSSGCVLANRLSADPGIRVLLLEAGPRDTNLYLKIPIGFAKLTAGPFEWGFKSVPQRHAANRVIPLAQGRVLGGGSSINAQVFTRGVPEDYDEWAAVHGCDGWSFKDIQQYYVRSEDNDRLSAPWHGVGGPLGVSDIVNLQPLSRAFIRAGQEFGLPFNGDFTAANPYGVGPYQTTTRDARRCSASVGYLNPVLGRPNLTVRTDVMVTRIVLDGRRATGVEVADKSGVQRIDAEREVLLVAGTIGSPKLLMLSGIGDPAHLKEVGIETRVPLQGVGKNLHDHYDIDIIYEVNGPHSLERYNNKLWAAWAGVEYVLFKKGPITSTAVEGGAFSFANKAEKVPDLQFHFLPAAGVEAGVSPPRSGYGCTLNSYFVRPRSRGSVRLASSDPRQAPLIDPNYIADDYDLEISVEGVRQSREIMSQVSMMKYVKSEHFPGPDVKTKDDCIRYARNYGRTSYHHVGTCRMGKGDDSVVAPDLKVRGVEGLRVCDASVMPRIVSSNTNAPAMMIGEKAADLVRAAA
jgi:choline dehydrogenase-like flavoprotein